MRFRASLSSRFLALVWRLSFGGAFPVYPPFQRQESAQRKQVQKRKSDRYAVVIHRHGRSNYAGIPYASGGRRTAHRCPFFQDGAPANKADSGNQALQQARLSGNVRLIAKHQQIPATSHAYDGKRAHSGALRLKLALPTDTGRQYVADRHV